MGIESTRASSSNVTLNTTHRPGLRLNALDRYENPHSPAPTVSTVSSSRSYARTDTIVSETSCPYAPTFWIGVAPTEPGMPDRHSTPARPSATQRATSGSQGSPAATVPPSTPREAMRSTVPGKPASATTRLEPPATISRGSPASSAARTVATIAASSCASTKRPAGPPRRRVVRSERAVAIDGPAYPRPCERSSGGRCPLLGRGAVALGDLPLLLGVLFAGAQLARALRLGVELDAEQHRHVRDPQPEQEDDDASERAVGLVVGAEHGDVEREQRGGDEPDDK